MVHAMKANQWAKTRLALNIYIAVAVTVLGVMILSQVGTNNTQNHRLALQAKKLGQLNHESAIEGCHRGNFVRKKINVVAGALADLLRKSVAESERKGHLLTPSQLEFVEREYELLAPLRLLNCKSKYPGL